MDIAKTIREYVVENFLFGDEEELEENVSFLESGIVDSTGILELVAFIEETFDIIIEDDELVPENLDSIGNATRYIATKKGLLG